MLAFIDDLNLIRVETKNEINQISLKHTSLTWYKKDNGYQYFKSRDELLLHKEDVIWINGKEYPLHIGTVTLKRSFDKRFRYKEELGAIYQIRSTTFRVFSPVAKEINVVVDGVKYEMYYKDGIYERKVEGNYEKSTYYYEVRLVDKFEKALDPYALSNDFFDSAVIDLSKTIKVNELENKRNPIIYEAHVRDLTSGLEINNKGLYQGLFEYAKELEGSVIDYVKSLGITHLQLLPLQDFNGVNEFDKDAFYNWGYNPRHYFTLSSYYSKDPRDPYLKINELKEVVNALHNNGVGVVMDVVYNHVYDRNIFEYDKFVPGYFYRHDESNRPTESSFAGIDIETRRFMVRKLISDSLAYFAREFRIDGFRFDLMGLMDIKTMKRIHHRLSRINPNILLYGEGWNMDTMLPSFKRATIANSHELVEYGFFNDSFRNIFKGTYNTNQIGIKLNDKAYNLEVVKVLLGTTYLFENLNQAINYIEVHDNETMYDRLQLNFSDEKEIKRYVDFFNHLTLIAKGIPFIHAGSEVKRTKMGSNNSYQSSDKINMISYYINDPSLARFKELTKIRTSHPYNDLEEDVYVDNGLIKYTLKADDYDLIHYISMSDYERTEKYDGNIIFLGNDIKYDHNNLYFNKIGVYIVKKDK